MGVYYMHIEFSEYELAAIYGAMTHVANSTNLIESYDPIHKQYMPHGTFAEAYYDAMTKIKSVSNSNIVKGVNYFSN